MKLFGQDFHPRVRRVRVAAIYASVDLTLEEYNPLTSLTNLEATEIEKRKYLRINPTGSLPTLETPEGPLYETNAILRYIARVSKSHKLNGNSEFDRALVDQWLDWSITELEPHALAFMLPYLGLIPYMKEGHNKAKQNLIGALKILDNHLKEKKFIVGDHVTLADIQIASVLHFNFQWLFDQKYRESIPNITNWYQIVTSEENWKKEYGRTILCKTPLIL